MQCGSKDSAPASKEIMTKRFWMEGSMNIFAPFEFLRYYYLHYVILKIIFETFGVKMGLGHPCAEEL